MARLKSIAIGPGVGSAGDATYRNVRGRTIMSARIRTNSSNTPQQAARRTIFALAQGIFKMFRFWPELCFERTKYGSCVNAANKYNLHNIEDAARQTSRKDEGTCTYALLKPSSTLHVQAAKGSLPYVGTTLASTSLLPNLTNCNVIVLDPSAIEGVSAPAITFISMLQESALVPMRPYAITFSIVVGTKAEVQAMSSAQILADAAAGALHAFVDGDTLLKVVFPLKVSGSTPWGNRIAAYIGHSGIGSQTAANYKAADFNPTQGGFHTIAIEDRIASLAR